MTVIYRQQTEDNNYSKQQDTSRRVLQAGQREVTGTPGSLRRVTVLSPVKSMLWPDLFGGASNAYRVECVCGGGGVGEEEWGTGICWGELGRRGESAPHPRARGSLAESKYRRLLQGCRRAVGRII